MKIYFHFLFYFLFYFILFLIFDYYFSVWFCYLFLTDNYSADEYHYIALNSDGKAFIEDSVSDEKSYQVRFFESSGLKITDVGASEKGK